MQLARHNFVFRPLVGRNINAVLTMMAGSLHDSMRVLDPVATRRDVKASLTGKTPVSSLKRREVTEIAANLKLNEDLKHRAGGFADYVALKNFKLTDNPHRVYLMGGTVHLWVAANTVNGASLSNEREGYMRKRMLLFNDIILICKAHKGKKNECGQEEFDDTSIEGVNELELVLDMESVKLNHVILGKTGETLESFARDLLKGDAMVNMKEDGVQQGQV